MGLFDEAKDKLQKEAGAAKFGNKEKAMESAVRKALEEFCRQSEIFCERIIKGGSFEECMKAVAKGVGSSISDLEAYKKAVKYYWPEATVTFRMEIAVGEERREQAPALQTREAGNAEIIDLSAFF